jgi:hypothetical protein
LGGIIHWARNSYQVTAGDAGSVEEPPDNLVVLEADHYIEDFTATRTDMDRAKVAQVRPKRCWYALLVFQQAE